MVNKVLHGSTLKLLLSSVSLVVRLFKMLYQYRLAFLVNWLSLLEIIFHFRKYLWVNENSWYLLKISRRNSKSMLRIYASNYYGSCSQEMLKKLRPLTQILSQHICCMTAGYRRTDCRGLHNYIFIHYLSLHIYV